MSDLYLFKNTLRDLLRPGKITAAILLIGVIALVAFAARFGTKPDEFNPGDAYNFISTILVFGFALTILSVVFGTGVVTEEMEQKTIPYLLTRPIPRWRILLVKFIAMFLVTTAIVYIAEIISAVLLFGVGKIGNSKLTLDMRLLPIGVLAYGAVSLLMSTLIKKPLIIGLLYCFCWETWTPFLPGDWHKVSLMSYIRSLAPHLKRPDEDSVLPVLQTPIPEWMAWSVLSGVIIVALLTALIVFSNREYTPTEETN